MNYAKRASDSIGYALACCLLMTACKQPATTGAQRNAAKAPAPAPKLQAEPEREPPPAEDPFALPDDAPIDPAEEEKALRHNCCDEMPAGEIKAHSKHE